MGKYLQQKGNVCDALLCLLFLLKKQEDSRSFAPMLGLSKTINLLHPRHGLNT